MVVIVLSAIPRCGYTTVATAKRANPSPRYRQELDRIDRQACGKSTAAADQPRAWPHHCANRWCFGPQKSSHLISLLAPSGVLGDASGRELDCGRSAAVSSVLEV